MKNFYRVIYFIENLKWFMIKYVVSIKDSKEFDEKIHKIIEIQILLKS